MKFTENYYYAGKDSGVAVNLKTMPARLDSVIYDEWLKEAPKKIEGGDLELTLCDGYCEADDAWNLEAHKILSNVLDSIHFKNLYIMGVYDKFEGFKIYVNIKNRFLLMGHQHHPDPYITSDGVDHGDHPHFHQIRYYWERTGGRATRKTHVFSSLLFPGMDSEEFLKAFLMHYYFDHVEDGEIKKQKIKQFQSELQLAYSRSEGTK